MDVLLIIAGSVVIFVGTVMFLIAAFQESVLWGIGCLIFGPVQFIFLILHFDVAAKPFFIQMGGFTLIIAGILLGAGG